MKQAVILAGGKGTRLRSVMGDAPKPLAEIGPDTLLGHQIALLRRFGVEEVLVLVNYGAEHINNWLRLRDFSPLRVRLIDDGEPKGTAGAVLSVFSDLADEFFVLYADTMVGVDLDRFAAFHAAVPETAASLFVHPNDHPADSDLVEIDPHCRIIAFHPYPHPEGVWLPNLVNAALYVIKRDALVPWRAASAVIDFGKHLFPEMVAQGCLLRGYNSPEYIKDAGTPARLDRVRAAFQAGMVERASLVVPQRAVFVDRDGTLNIERGFICRAEDLKLIPGVGRALRRLNDNEWRTVVVTNQPVLARGEASEAELSRIHARLETEVARDHAFFDRLYYCAHHPDRGFAGEVTELKVTCECRKPAPGLILEAARDLNIRLAESWLVGDSTRDLGAAERAGVSAILVGTGDGGRDETFAYEPSFVQADFAAAVDFILDDYPRLEPLCASILERFSDSSVVFVGGLARSGKSTLAGALVREMRRRGRGARVIALDRWIRDRGARGEGVFGRYDLDAIEEMLREIEVFRNAISNRMTITLPYYSRVKRRRLDKTIELGIDRGDFLVIEGVPAIEVARRLGQVARSIYVSSDETARRRRFHAYDITRGLSYEESRHNFSEREYDEHTIIAAAKGSSGLVVSLDGLISDRPMP